VEHYNELWKATKDSAILPILLLPLPEQAQQYYNEWWKTTKDYAGLPILL